MALVAPGGAFGAEAAKTAKLVNKTDRTIHAAALVEGATDMSTEGWRKIDLGKSWNDVSKGSPAYWSSGWGYYACAPKKGAKTVYWREDGGQAPIRPTKNFDAFNDVEPDGVITAGFNRMSWKTREDEAAAMIKFTIN